MDNIDKKIVFELQKNGRLSNFDLAEKVGLSPSPCLRRIKNLETTEKKNNHTTKHEGVWEVRRRRMDRWN